MYLFKALIIHLATLLAGCAAVQDLILKSTPSNTNFGEIEALPRVRQSIYDLNKSEWPSIRSKTPLLRCPGALFDHRDVKIALRQASRLYKEGQLVGYNKYPHFYGNIEGFEFSASEPYMVFPIKYAEAYNGGPPGHSRVVMSKEGLEFVGAISHQYSGYGEFKQCQVPRQLLQEINQLDI